MYDYKTSKELDRIFKKLSKKDKILYEQILKKIDEIVKCYDISSYKNLRYNMKEYKRVHVGHFVLIFRYNEKQNTIYFVNFRHHDDIYKV